MPFFPAWVGPRNRALSGHWIPRRKGTIFSGWAYFGPLCGKVREILGVSQSYSVDGSSDAFAVVATPTCISCRRGTARRAGSVEILQKCSTNDRRVVASEKPRMRPWPCSSCWVTCVCVIGPRPVCKICRQVNFYSRTARLAPDLLWPCVMLYHIISYQKFIVRPLLREPRP